MNLIALTGPQLAGKTTLARELERRGWRYIDFTGYLKEIAADALNFSGAKENVTRSKIEQDKPRYRRFLQELATLIGYDTDPYFVRDALCKSAWQEGIQAVFDNVRTMEQWQVLKGYGFTLVRLDTKYTLRYMRAQDLYHVGHDAFESQHDHVIEQGGALWDEATVVLDGSLNVVNLADQLVGGSNETAGER